MQTLFVAFDAQPGMSTEEFRSYYRDNHAPIVAELPHLDAYTVTFPNNPDRAPFDGIATLQFPDSKTFREAMESDPAAAMEADAAEFIDQDSLVQFVGSTESLLS